MTKIAKCYAKIFGFYKLLSFAQINDILLVHKHK